VAGVHRENDAVIASGSGKTSIYCELKAFQLLNATRIAGKTSEHEKLQLMAGGQLKNRADTD
jgi:hypothetical protein